MQGYTIPTPIQEQAIPIVLEGRDLLGCAQTGTGKTAAFAMPILQLLYQKKELDKKNAIQRPSPVPIFRPLAGRQRNMQQETDKRTVKVLVMTPTRELAIQIGESFADYGKFTGMRHAVIFGGVSQSAQTNALRSGVDILVATPGRLLDLIGQKFIHLDSVEIFVLDEADRMLDMGFVHDMKKVIAMLPTNRQTLMFSATMPVEITKLVNTILKNPTRVEVTPAASTVDLIDQTVYFVEKKDKKYLLNKLLENEAIESALIFTRTKHGADKVVKDLASANVVAQAIHGNKSQAARQLALNNFKLKQTRVLVATDIAARGIDVRELTHVINYDLPNIPETYVHRIGRTGRAGLVGTAISFCDIEEREYLKDIQKLISKKIPVVEGHPYESTLTEADLKAMTTGLSAQPGQGQRQQRLQTQQRQPRQPRQQNGQSARSPRQQNGQSARSPRQQNGQSARHASGPFHQQRQDQEGRSWQSGGNPSSRQIQ